MSVTFGASNNATPASGVVVATCSIESEEYQLVILADAAGNSRGVGAASPLFVSACLTNLAGSAAGSPLFTSITNSPSVIVSSGSVVVTNGVSASISNTVTVAQGASGASPWGARIVDANANQYGYGAASPLFVSACITNQAGSAAGSPIFTSITNLAGSAAGSPLFTSITNLAGSAAGSPLFVSQNNMSGSTAGSPIFSSITNLAGSAAGSPLFTSITNLAGSSAGSPLFTRVGDGADTAFVDAASRLAVALTDGTDAFGLAGSPLPVVPVVNQVYYSGSFLTVNLINLSASSSGCIRIVASSSGKAIVVIGATYTTSSCQFIGWIASGAGAASANVQTAMPFGTNGGMTETDLLWEFPSGSNAILTTTSACNVAGRLKYLLVAS